MHQYKNYVKIQAEWYQEPNENADETDFMCM